MSENTNNSNNSDYIEYYMLNAWWGQDWIHIAFCNLCGITFDPESGNVYKLKKEYYDICFCEPCINELKKKCYQRVGKDRTILAKFTNSRITINFLFTYFYIIIELLR